MTITLKNFTKANSMDLRDTWYGIHDGNFLNGLAVLADGEDSGMGVFPIGSDIPVTEPDLPDILVTNNQGVLGAAKGTPDAAVTAVLNQGAVDLDFMSVVTGLTINTAGAFEELLATQAFCDTLKSIYFIINTQGKNGDVGSGNFGALGYMVKEIFYATIDVKGVQAFARNAANVPVANMTCQYRDVFPWGETISNVLYGAKLAWGFRTYWSQFPVTAHAFRGDGAVTTLTLLRTPAAESADAVRNWEAGVEEDYTTDFSVTAATKALDFVVAPTAGVMNICKYQYLPECG